MIFQRLFRTYFQLNSFQRTFTKMVVPKTDIILYTSGTPNGQKASITLEELGLNYEAKNIQERSEGRLVSSY